MSSIGHNRTAWHAFGTHTFSMPHTHFISICIAAAFVVYRKNNENLFEKKIETKYYGMLLAIGR